MKYIVTGGDGQLAGRIAADMFISVAKHDNLKDAAI